MTMAVEAGRAIVLAFNKWDTLDEERRYYLEREIETELLQVAWAPRVNVSARTGRHMEKLVPAIEAALDGWETRVPTGRLNAFLGELVAAHPHPVRGGKQPASSRNAGRHQAPAVRALRLRLHRAPLPALHRAPGCARSSASRGRRSTSPYGCARSAAPRRSDVATGEGRLPWEPPPVQPFPLTGPCGARAAARPGCGAVPYRSGAPPAATPVVDAP